MESHHSTTQSAKIFLPAMALQVLLILSGTGLREVRVIEGGGTSYLDPSKNLMGYGNHTENFLCIQPKCVAALRNYFDV